MFDTVTQAIFNLTRVHKSKLTLSLFAELTYFQVEVSLTHSLDPEMKYKSQVPIFYSDKPEIIIINSARRSKQSK